MDTSAIMGFTNSLLDLINRERPDHLAVCFDREVRKVEQSFFQIIRLIEKKPQSL